MERPQPLEICGAASLDDAYADVVSWVHRDADEGIRCGCAAYCSLRRSRWHHDRQVMRAYRLITTVLPQDFFQSGVKTYQDMSEYMEEVGVHLVGRPWVDCLINPSLLALQLLHTQRNNDFPLHHVSLETMMPYYFAAST